MGRTAVAVRAALRGMSSGAHRRAWMVAFLLSSVAAAQDVPVVPPDAPKPGGEGEAQPAPEATAEPPRPTDLPDRPQPPSDKKAVVPAAAAPKLEPAPAVAPSETRGSTYAGTAPEPPPAPAESEPTALESPVQVHGFVSQGFIGSTGNNYLAYSKRGSFEFTEVGINLTKEITDNFRVGVQLFTRDLGPIGNYSAQFDWFYLDYRFFDWLGIRAGRTKLPFGLYNETSDIDAARVPILLPQSVYPITSRDFLLAQTGAEIYGLVPLGSAGDIDYRAYGGTLAIDLRYEGTSNDSIKKIDTPYIVGGRLMWRTPIQGLQLGGSVQKLRLDFDYTLPEARLGALRAAGQLPTGFSGLVSARIPAVLAVGSIEYAPGDLLIAAEYARWRTKIESTLPVIFPDSTTTSERFYVMGSYRLNNWFVPGVYYSAQFPDVDMRSGRENHQHDFAATLRFDVNSHWLWKLEGHFMRGTAGASSELNYGTPRGSLERDWLVFLVKTTAYF